MEGFKLSIKKGTGEVIDLSGPKKGRLEYFFADGSWNYYNEKDVLIAFYPDDTLRIEPLGIKEEILSPTPSGGA